MPRPPDGQEAPVRLLARRLKQWLLAHDWPAGTRLPSERQLAHELGSSRPSVRRAIRLLESDGTLVDQAHGRGLAQACARSGESDSTADAVAIIAGSSCHLPPPGADGTFFTDQFAVIRGALQQAGWPSRLIGARTVAELDAGLASLTRPPIGWIVLDDVVDREVQSRLLSLKTTAPRVMDGAHLHPAQEDRPGIDRVISDQAAGASMLVRHLHSLGAKRLVQTWLPPGSGRQQRRWARDRLRGFTTTCKELRLPNLVTPLSTGLWAVSQPIEVDLIRRAWIGLLTELLAESPRPVGICTVSDDEVLVAGAAARILGLQPGRDLLLAGYDHYLHRDWVRRIMPDPPEPAATIDQDLPQVASIMVDLLGERLRGRRGPAVERRVTPTLITAAGPGRW